MASWHTILTIGVGKIRLGNNLEIYTMANWFWGLRKLLLPDFFFYKKRLFNLFYLTFYVLRNTTSIQRWVRGSSWVLHSIYLYINLIKNVFLIIILKIYYQKRSSTTIQLVIWDRDICFTSWWNIFCWLW